MNSKLVGIIKIVVSLALLSLAFIFTKEAYSFFFPNYNDNSSFKYKKLVGECGYSKTSEEFGLYVFEGSHATTSDSYSVYYRRDIEENRQLIFSAYSSPVIEKILCEPSALILVELNGESISLPLDKMDILVKEPIRFYKSNKMVGRTSAEVQNGFCCSSLALSMIAVIPFLFIRKKRNN